MNNKIIPLALASLFVISACDLEKKASNSSTTSETISKDDAVAIVNGSYISKAALSELETQITQRSQGRSFPKEKILEELIQREILQQEAVNKQLDKSAEFVKKLETVKKSLLAQETVQDYLKSNPLTDAEIEAEYNQNVGEAGTEYKARHILVKTEDEAKSLIEELKKGADFIELAKTKSTGPSGPKGGDLGWFAAGQMVAPFSEATIALENGKFTHEAVKTQFGWHVILREDSRSQTPPPFDSVKEQIRPMLQRKKMQEFMDNLRQQAKVEILLAPEQKEVVAPKADATTAPAGTESKAAESATEKTADNTEIKADPAKSVETAVKEIKTEVTEQSKQITKSVSDSTKNVVGKAAEQADAKAKAASTAITETVEKAKQSVKETTTDKTNKALDALAQ